VAEQLRFPGSPTIRVDGRDVQPGFEDPADYTSRCRLYWPNKASLASRHVSGSSLPCADRPFLSGTSRIDPA